MQKMKTDDLPPGSRYHFDNMETESIGTERPFLSGPLNRKAGKKSARFNIPDSTMAAPGKDSDAYVEITLDVRDDAVTLHSVKAASGMEIEDPEISLLARTLEKKPSSLGSTLIRSASSRIRQMTQGLKNLASLTTRSGPGPVDRSKSAAAHALKGLKFISKTDGGAGWPAVEKRFDELAGVGGLSRSLFGQCIGMKESKEFAGELFDALARRRNITGDSITKDELREFWDQIADQSFDSRLQTFFDMHPFSITSAPQDDYVSVHIRTLGDWTGKLKMVFSEVYQRSTDDRNSLLRPANDVDSGDPNQSRFPKVMIDGPYGAPAQDYKNYEVVLFVGLGIGATPFISIVKDITNNMRMLEGIEDGRQGWGGNGASPAFRTRRAYFYWVTREQGSFEWFSGVMNEVAEIDREGAIELHNYCTSVYEEGDARSALIAMLQSLNHAKNGVDVVSGTRVKSHFGRPNWRNVFKRIALNHRDRRIGVFYCGATTLTKELRQLSQDFSHKTKTKFDFHKENF